MLWWKREGAERDGKERHEEYKGTSSKTRICVKDMYIVTYRGCIAVLNRDSRRESLQRTVITLGPGRSSKTAYSRIDRLQRSHSYIAGTRGAHAIKSLESQSGRNRLQYTLMISRCAASD